jgi:hypothetical protein
MRGRTDRAGSQRGHRFGARVLPAQPVLHAPVRDAVARAGKSAASDGTNRLDVTSHLDRPLPRGPRPIRLVRGEDGGKPLVGPATAGSNPVAAALAPSCHRPGSPTRYPRISPSSTRYEQGFSTASHVADRRSSTATLNGARTDDPTLPRIRHNLARERGRMPRTHGPWVHHGLRGCAPNIHPRTPLYIG